MLSIERALMMHSYLFAQNITWKLLNRQHKNIRFTSEIENENSVSLLDIKISRDNNKFTTLFTTKQPLAEFLPTLKASSRTNINSLLFTLLHRAFKLCWNFQLFHQVVDKLKTIFENNGYPKCFVDLCTKTSLVQLFIKRGSSAEGFKKGTYMRPSFYWEEVTATENSCS